ncbi:MAG: hypothetical protein RJA83_326, partial [Pseudomonadota bacterium]
WASAWRTPDESGLNISRVMRTNFGDTTAKIFREHSDSLDQMGMGITEFAPNATKAAQKQTGPELCYVLEGEITFMVEGQAPRRFKAGDSYQNLPNLVHWTKAGTKGAKILATWALQPGKPFVTIVR